MALSGPAPAGGVVLSVYSDHPLALQVPRTVTVPAGKTSITFSFTTSRVTTNTAVNVVATYAKLTRYASPTVTP